MPRRFWVSLVLLLLCLAMAVGSLFSVRWTGRGGAVCIALGQGTAWCWSGKPGDMRGAGVEVGGWSGDALLWKPEWERAQKVWVSRPRARSAVQIVGLSVRVPMYVPLLLLSLTTGLLWRANRLSIRRARAGQCRSCGYDLSGTPQRCPECGREVSGGVFRALLRRLGVRPRGFPLSGAAGSAPA
jgi:hypothetical protein